MFASSPVILTVPLLGPASHDALVESLLYHQLPVQSLIVSVAESFFTADTVIEGATFVRVLCAEPILLRHVLLLHAVKV